MSKPETARATANDETFFRTYTPVIEVYIVPTARAL